MIIKLGLKAQLCFCLLLGDKEGSMLCFCPAHWFCSVIHQILLADQCRFNVTIMAQAGFPSRVKELGIFDFLIYHPFPHLIRVTPPRAGTTSGCLLYSSVSPDLLPALSKGTTYQRKCHIKFYTSHILFPFLSCKRKIVPHCNQKTPLGKKHTMESYL